MPISGYSPRALILPTLALALLSACGSRDEAAGSPAVSMDGPFNAITRADFNQRAAAAFLPLFWREDSNNDGAIQPDELAILWGIPENEVNRWIDQSGDFTNHFKEAYGYLIKSGPPTSASGPESKRLALVYEELAQGVPTLVQTDLRNDSAAERAMVRHLMKAAERIERIYARQKGALGIGERIPETDTASRALFHRNQSPFCEAPMTQNDPECSAVSPKPPNVFGLYPADIQQEPGFCEKLAQQPNAAELMDHFSIVVNGEKPGTYIAVPYNVAYKEDMEVVAEELEAAAKGFGEDESALTAYLRAAAQGFRTNDWEPANRAWVAMNARNSKWYARIGPDEVYFDPCAWKAGFALQLARINPESLEWQKRLEPHKQAMEQQLASLAGAPYKARNVQFALPDFIDVVLNAGDARNPHGATIGQSLPNWGPVAESGGRTVAMTNLYSDPDSRARQEAQEASVFCSATNARTGNTGRESLLNSLMHEAAHNLGPSREYKAYGKVDTEAFGGPLASTLEELKAENSAMYLVNWLTHQGVFTAEEAQRIHAYAIAWTFGHISRGMYTADGTPRNYSQLAAIQLGSFIDAGALEWKAEETAANGQDKGCLEIHFEKLPAAIESLERTVLQIKARGDKTAAEQLVAKYVDAKDDFARIKDSITERWLRSPKATFVYSIVF